MSGRRPFPVISSKVVITLLKSPSLAYESTIRLNVIVSSSTPKLCAHLIRSKASLYILAALSLSTAMLTVFVVMVILLSTMCCRHSFADSGSLTRNNNCILIVQQILSGAKPCSNIQFHPDIKSLRSRAFAQPSSQAVHAFTVGVIPA
ncbi:hypothetical protein AA313_de0202352 [Arthrobotrys entomopaga]|nr:hypothetical protein AA313_de0202352 [Arthrobotrys entomopaga]